MEKKSFKKYFTQSNKLLYTSIGIFAAAALLWIITNYWLFSWELYQASYVIATIGAICLISHFTIRIKDSAVDAYAETFNKAMEEELDTFVTETEKHKIIKRVYTYASSSYKLWSDEATLTKFGSDGTPRCEVYEGIAVTYTPETFYAVIGKLDLLTGDTCYTRHYFPVSDIKTVKTVDKSFTIEYKKNTRFVETHILEIDTGDKAVCSTVHADAMTDEAVQKLARLAETKKD